MNKSLLFLLALCPAITLAAEPKAELPPAPGDFAYAIPLQVDGQSALYQAALPPDVYRNTVRSDLGDLRVFNGADEIVPHRIIMPNSATREKSDTTRLNLFPLQTTGNEGLDQVSVRMQRNASGTLLSMDASSKPGAKSQLSGYLLDASAVKQPIQSLELAWSGTGDSFSGTASVECSDDLKRWQHVANDAPVASLQHGGHRLEQKQISFAPVTCKYLRLSWPSAQAPLKLNGVAAELAPKTTEAPLTWSNITGQAVADHPGEYQFDLGAHLPIQRMRFKLPQANTLAEVTLSSRGKESDKWQLVSRTTLYQLQQNGKELSNADLRLYSQHRYWQLKVDTKNGGLGSGSLQLEAGWQPHQLQFIARGNPPFRVVYGSGTIKPVSFQFSAFLTGSTDEQDKLDIRNAMIGSPAEMGSASNLAPAQEPLPWKKWLLWGSLVLAVLLLSWMAHSLMQQMVRTKKQ